MLRTDYATPAPIIFERTQGVVLKRELRSIADDLKAGREVEPVTVRTFLWWFEAQRRGPYIVRGIRRELEEAGLITVPDFESRWIDAPINFSLIDTAEIPLSTEPAPPDGYNYAEAGESWVSRDATYRISKLAAANKEVVRVSPDAALAEAVTLLLARDFSQLAVMTGEREVKGIVSWKTIGARLALGKASGAVRDFMEPHYEVRSASSIFEAIPAITRHNYVLVRGEQNTVVGIVTASDLSEQFQTLSEPFLLLSEIENLIRNLIGKKFTVSQLATAIDPGGPSRPIMSVDDLTFGEYIRLLQKPDRWAQLGLAIDRALFCKDFDAIREIRNDVTHFDPDGITKEEIDYLRDFKSLLETLEAISR